MQNIGGNGGAGGSDVADYYALGGSGGSGGYGGNITGSNAGTIRTLGNQAPAMSALSLGGGGGDGGDALELSVIVGGVVGGSAGGGGSGGTVNLTLDYGGTDAGVIATSGRHSSGLVASSIGGGGGHGGAADGFTVGVTTAVQMSVGGKGGSGGQGGDVSISTQSGTTIYSGYSTNPTEITAGLGPLTGDHSLGILAQSIGGGGGMGGNDIAAAASVGEDADVSLSFALGGQSGDGGHGGQVTVQNSSLIQSMGRMADGVYASSVGGGGGHGGNSVSAALAGAEIGGSIAVAVGGTGGKGGDGGTVVVTHAGTIATYSSRSNGVFAQSIGGGGGYGGSITDVAGSVGKKSLALNVGVGGTGGDGGDGGEVDVTLLSGAEILTAGHQSLGVLAQSIGGGGGAGGNVNTYAVAVSGGKSGKSAAVSVDVGGKGGAGGVGGAVNVTTSSDVVTTGDQSSGILAQSVGGGGGHGGNVMALSIAASLNPDADASSGDAGQNFSASVAVGGAAGNGQTGGDVSVTANAGTIHTTGVQSSAIHAQSIGGGGGVGGNAHSFAVSTNMPTTPEPASFLSTAQAVNAKFQNWLNNKDANGTDDESPSSFQSSVSVGGKGGTGGDASSVSVILNSSGTINTENHQSHGIHAQSIGGGGGAGGTAYADGILGVDSNGLNMSVGGKGGAGGNGNKITIQTAVDAGSIVTQGDYSYGILAQSVGGGGGTGGLAASSIHPINKQAKKSILVSIGGSEGASGSGGGVVMTLNSDIATSGHGSSAIFAQSIGGGGGLGAQSGVGTEGTASFGLGGSGGAAGDGGEVNITLDADFSASGDAAPVVHAQSIGGGGGHGGVSSSDSAKVLAIGGNGGNGGDGGSVAITAAGTIYSSGAVSPGILAQSIGGGGGSIGTGKLGPSSLGITNPFDISTSGDRGKGGAVTVSDANIITIKTSGDGSHGIVAQSAGAGGGLVLVPDDASQLAKNIQTSYAVPSLEFVAQSSSGNVDVNLFGSIATSGNNAYGILAMSRVNSLGVLDTQGVQLYESEIITPFFFGLVVNGSVGVTVNPGATISTTGAGSDGIRAYANSTATNAVNVAVNGGVQVSGSNAWGVRTVNSSPALTTDATTQITVGQAGSITASGNAAGAISIGDDTLGPAVVEISGSVNAQNKWALLSGQLATNVAINANGQVFGNIGATDAMKSAYAAQYSSNPPTFILPAVTNAGGAMHGSMVGPWNYNILEGGRHFLSVNPNGPGSDVLQVEWIDAEQGSVMPVLTALPSSNFSPVTLVTLNGLPHIGFMSGGTLSTVYGYAVDQNSITLQSVDVDYTRAGLTGNYGQLAGLAMTHLPTLEGDSSLTPVLLDAANATTINDLEKALSTLNADAHFGVVQTAMASATTHLDSMQSCNDFSSKYAPIAQVDCNWGKATLMKYSLRDGDQSQTSKILSFGRQQGVADNVFLGWAGGYEDVTFDSLSGHSDGYRVNAGGIAKYQKGPVFGNFSVGFSYGEADARRQAAWLTASSDHKATSVATRISGGRMFQSGSLDIIPRLDLDLAWIHDYGYQETGAGALDIEVHPGTNFLADLHPALRINKSFDDKGIAYQAYAEVGARFALNDPTFEMSLPNGGNPNQRISLTSERDDVVATVAAGLNFNSHKGYQVRLLYEGGFGQSTENQSGSIKLGFEF